MLLAPAMLAVWYGGRRRAYAAALVLGGYALLMAPWWGRNVALFGSLFPPGASRTLWLVNYDELYSYPASILSAGHWWDAGLPALLQARLQALIGNLQTLLAVNGIVFLAPLMIVGAVRLWKRVLVRLSILYLGLLFLLMSLALPQVGARGGFFHSSAALMPLFWGLAAQGLEIAVTWIGEKRSWHLPQAQRLFSVTAVLLGMILTAFLYWTRVIGADISRPSWGKAEAVYQNVGQHLSSLDPAAGIVAVNNPAGFHSATNLQAIAIPNGPPETLRQVVERYGAGWVILEANHPQALDDLYVQPIDLAWLELVDTILDNDGAGIHLMRVQASEVQP